MEYVIRGNSAIIKCQIPSFVADFVEVVSWHSDQDESYFPGTNYGLFFEQNNKFYILNDSFPLPIYII